MLLAPSHRCLCILLVSGETMIPLLLSSTTLLFSWGLSRFQPCVPSRQSTIATAEHCGCPLICMVCSFYTLGCWGRTDEGSGRSFQVNVVTGHIFGDYAVTGERRVNIVLGVCSNFGNWSWRQLCVRLDARLAVLELNQGFNFILNQLEKSRQIIKKTTNMI